MQLYHQDTQNFAKHKRVTNIEYVFSCLFGKSSFHFSFDSSFSRSSNIYLSVTIHLYFAVEHVKMLIYQQYLSLSFLLSHLPRQIMGGVVPSPVQQQLFPR